MGKQGPCYHCGVTSTPLWRNGPPDKPVLCNACGSRWRTKGTLANYTPLHLRAEPEIFEDHRISRVKFVSGNKNREPKLLKRKQYNDNVVISGNSEYKQDFRKVVDEDTSNRSSSGSAISNSESCLQFGGAEASDMSGPAQSVVWDTMVPSKKRTCVSRSRPSSIEKLTKDLHTILHEQRKSSYFSGSSEEDLLYESEIPMVSVEIGHGSVLIKHPNSISREEESEASSLSFDHKVNLGNEAYSNPTTFSVHNGYKGVKCQISGMPKDDRFTGQVIQQDQMRRGNVQLGWLEFVGNHNSALCAIDIKDIFNFEEFVRSLTSEEQQHLLKFLPPVDFAMVPHSLRGMFESPQFMENLISFQQLLSEGVFDDSLSGVKDEDRKTLERLALSSFAKSKWVEHYSSLKKCKNGSASFTASGQPCTIASNLLATVKRSCDGDDLCFSETKHKSPKRTMSKASGGAKEFVDIDGSDYTPTSVFALPHSSSSFMLDSFNFTDDSHDQDLLLDVPSNNSFPQEELLPTSSFGAGEASASTHVSSVPGNAHWRVL